MTTRLLAILPYALGVAFVVAAYAMDGMPASAPSKPTAQPVAPAISVPWVPGWLKEPLRRAIADATDPKTRGGR